MHDNIITFYNLGVFCKGNHHIRGPCYQKFWHQKLLNYIKRKSFFFFFFLLPQLLLCIFGRAEKSFSSQPPLKMRAESLINQQLCGDDEIHREEKRKEGKRKWWRMNRVNERCVNCNYVHVFMMQILHHSKIYLALQGLTTLLINMLQFQYRPICY